MFITTYICFIKKIDFKIPWELRPYRAAQYYDAELDEFEKPAPPKFIDPNEKISFA